MKRHYRPKLDPKQDLAGATPEALVRALFRQTKMPATLVEDACTLPTPTPENIHDHRSKRSTRLQDKGEALA